MQQRSEWTQGPLKWLLACTIASLGLLGLGWSILKAPSTDREQSVGVVQNQSATPQQSIPSPEQAEPADTAKSQANPEAPPSYVKLIRINHAPAAELVLLPGIGEARAQLIIESRKADGPFRSPADLERVSGIGPVTRDRIAPLISFE